MTRTLLPKVILPVAAVGLLLFAIGFVVRSRDKPTMIYCFADEKAPFYVGQQVDVSIDAAKPPEQ